MYYVFGMQVKERSWQDSSFSYRFAFNGKEQDNEVKGQGNSYDFGARIYDSRLGRWLSHDPLVKHSRSNYAFAINSPLVFIDPDGADDIYFDPDSKDLIVVPNNSPHRYFYTKWTQTPDPNKGTSITIGSIEPATTSQKAEMLSHQMLFDYAFKNGTIEDQKELLRFNHNQAGMTTLKASVVVVVGGASIILTAELVAAYGIVGCLARLGIEVTEAVAEELTGIPIIPIAPDPTDLLDPVINRTIREGLQREAKKEAIESTGDLFIKANRKRMNSKLGQKIGQGRLPFEASKEGVEKAVKTVGETLNNPSKVSKPFINSNGDEVIDVFSKETGFTVRVKTSDGSFDTLIDEATDHVK